MAIPSKPASGPNSFQIERDALHFDLTDMSAEV